MSRVWIWGAGELGGRVARLAVDGGATVVGLTLTKKRHKALRKAGVEARRGAPSGVEPADQLLLALPGHVAQHKAIKALAGTPPPRRAVLISSTGYYGARGGHLDAESPPGETTRAQAVAGVEAAFRAWAGEAGVILRLGGLYRCGRGPFSAFQKKRQPPPGPGDKTLALIHYDDAAWAAFEALGHPTPRDIYLGVIPPCPSRREFYLAASVLLGLNLPNMGCDTGQSPAIYEVEALRADLLPTPAHPRWQEALVP